MVKEKLFRDVKVFVDSLSENQSAPLYTLTPKEARQVLLDVQKEEIELPKVSAQKIDVDVGDGRKLKLLIVKPAGLTGEVGVVYYIHGGGWVMGDDVTHRRLISELAADIPAGVVFPIYTPSPEAQFPQVTEDLYKGLLYIAEHGDEYGLDSRHLAVAGDSVGGNMATVMALMAKEKGGVPPICFQLLLYPVTSAEFDSESYQTFENGPWLTREAMKWFWNQYLPDEEKRKAKEASPLMATVDELKELPPALVITGENDVLRDQGEAYARKLDEAGVKTISVRINGTIHDFMMLNALSEASSTRAAMSLAKAKLKWFLYGTK
ncbi:MAG: alpha/beta hydrolase [Alphaproteobacteria bacterium]|nr:alpha/beta hydrolase [Alphaproteobacteria bacterium]